MISAMCPACGAGCGEPCRTPKGVERSDVHAARVRGVERPRDLTRKHRSGR